MPIIFTHVYTLLVMGTCTHAYMHINCTEPNPYSNLHLSPFSCIPREFCLLLFLFLTLSLDLLSLLSLSPPSCFPPLYPLLPPNLIFLPTFCLCLYIHWWFPEAIHSLSAMAQEFLACFSQLSHEHCWYVAFPHPVQSLILPCSFQSLPCSWGLSPPNLVRQWWHQVTCVLKRFSFVLRTSCEVECGHSHALTTVYSVWIWLDFCVPRQFLFWMVQV